MKQDRHRVPSIKGTAFQSAPADLCRLLDEGRLSRERLEARLEAGDLELLEAKINPSAWYPIAAYTRMVELLADCEARHGRERYCIERGARAAQRLADAGIYQQLDATSEKLGARIGNFSITLSQLIYNFGRWRYEPGSQLGEFTVEVEDAADIPEVGRWATQGFIEVAATRIAGRPMQVESERRRRDRLVFRGRFAG